MKKLFILALLMGIFIAGCSKPLIKHEIGEPILLLGSWRCEIGDIILTFYPDNRYVLEVYKNEDDLIPEKYYGLWRCGNGYFVTQPAGNRIFVLRVVKLTANEFHYVDSDGVVSKWIKLDKLEL